MRTLTVARFLLSAGATIAMVGAPLASAANAEELVRPVVVVSNAPADPDNLLVRFKPGADQSKVASLIGKHKLTETTNLDEADVTMYDVGTTETPASVAKALIASGTVELAEPDYRLTASNLSNDTRITENWGLQNTGQSIGGQTGISGVDLDVANAWNTTSGSGVIVAVIDEGIDIDHPELASHIWTNTADCYSDGVDHDNDGYVNDCHGWDFYNRDNVVYEAQDSDDHGTHVAGTIAATANNNVGIAGVAPNAQIMPLKFLGPNGGSTSDAITAIGFAKAHGARIVNCSWGGTAFSQALKDAIANSGMLFTVAAGNSGVSNASSPQYPAAFDLPNLISVAATDNRGALASFSNYGANTAVGAPGVNILSTVPRRGVGTVAVDNSNQSGSWKTGFWGFGLEAVNNATIRKNLLTAELQRLGATSLTSPILIVDDDESSSGASGTPDTRSYYTAALSAAGYSNVTTSDIPKNASGPSNSSMAGKYVIWETGYAVGTTNTYTLTGSDLSNLTSFVSGGGKLLLAGGDSIWRNETNAFTSTYLGVVFADEGDERTAVTGKNGTAYAGLSLSINGAESPKATVNTYQDRVNPTGTYAVAGLQLAADTDYSKAYDYKSGTSMASPHVAGVAALAAQLAPSASPTTLASYVKGGVTALTSLGNGVTTTGGMVNAAATVRLAQSGSTSGAASGAGSVAAPAPTTSSSAALTASSAPDGGYRFVANDGGIFSFGNAQFAGSAGGSALGAPIIGMAATPVDTGYWLVGADGGVYNYNAPALGSLTGKKLNQPIVGMAATPSGNGYWLVASDGGIFAYGDAAFYGSTGAIKLNKPIVAMASTPSGKGYWLIASDGGIFAYGDASFYGSTGAIKLNKPIVAASPTTSGKGYWLVASDGGIFSFGDAGFFGSAGALKLNQPIVGMSSTASGSGYWLVASDGGVFSYGDAAFYGSTGAIKLNKPIVGMSR